jgi:orotidine 5'-phosphate decarboxylase subfamily 2
MRSGPMITNTYRQLLAESSERSGSVLCFGMDPVAERMKIDVSRNIGDEIIRYFSSILRAVSGRLAAVKPNAAFYLQYGAAGLNALARLTRTAHEMSLPVIVDLKAGDIGRTSKAYARFVFEEIGGDAVTLNPYMGFDAVEPFTAYGDRGMYILALTSNPSSRDLQFNALRSGTRLFEHVLDIIGSWSERHGGIGAVIGATQQEFTGCVERLVLKESVLPLLVPGVGTQGGNYTEIMGILQSNHYEHAFVRINSSSYISYAHERYTDVSFDEAAYMAIDKLTGSR